MEPVRDSLLRRIHPSAAHSLVLTGGMLTCENPVESLVVDLETDTAAVFPETTVNALEDLVKKMMTEFEPGDTAMDRAMAVELHRCLPIPRRLAAERRVWHYLGLVRFPEFVCHRWPLKAGKDGVPRRPAERFLGDRVRNTFARLWWLAELTIDEENGYQLTDELLQSSGFQDKYEAFFGRAFCGYRPALEAFINVTRNQSESVVRETAKGFGRVLTTLVLESQSTDDLQVLVTSLVSDAQSSEGAA